VSAALMQQYYCYFYDRNGHFTSRFDFNAISDDDAIIEARAKYAESKSRNGFELWRGPNQIIAEDCTARP
jgi:hypothetical protein